MEVESVKMFGSILWLFFGGMVAAVPLIMIGVVLCSTLVGIPLGMQCFELAKKMLSPMGERRM